MKILSIKIIFLISLELVLSRGDLYDEEIDDNDRDNEISADVKDILKVIGSTLGTKIDEDSKEI
jgi:hypothetical protein